MDLKNIKKYICKKTYSFLHNTLNNKIQLFINPFDLL